MSARNEAQRSPAVANEGVNLKAHRTDPVSLTFALIFLAIAGWWLIVKIVGVTVPDIGWFVAGLLIVAGVLGLLGALRAGRSPAAPVTAPPDADRTEVDRDPAG